jgi:Ni/Co efflux regulator RcnB
MARGGGGTRFESGHAATFHGAGRSFAPAHGMAAAGAARPGASHFSATGRSFASTGHGASAGMVAGGGVRGAQPGGAALARNGPGRSFAAEPRANAMGASRAAGFAAATQRAGGPAAVQARYSPGGYPAAVTASQHYFWHGGGWVDQPGYYPWYWGYGDYLPFYWFAPPFWIVDYWWYGLRVAPWGFVWVRVGPDALLVDAYTGEVVEVEYGLFW